MGFLIDHSKFVFKCIKCFLLRSCFKFSKCTVCCDKCVHFFQFGVNWDVYMTKPDYSYKCMKTGDLLPLCFVPESLEEERISQSA